jgi:CRP/FNR family cyclic AMP-dependent transcriptional regulator
MASRALLEPADRYAALTPALRVLAARGVAKSYRKGQRLIEEGDTSDTLYIITHGRVRVFGSSDNGREITYGICEAGEYLGEMSLDGGPRSASVEAIESVQCVQVTRQTLLLHIAEHPEFALELIAKIIRRARSMTLSTKQLALSDAYGRLVALLDALAQPQADGTRQIAERPTHQDMASRLGCSREMISRLMKDLERGGFVSTDGRVLTIPRPLPARW